VEPWSIRAVNLPEHADNPVHTEAGGRAAGFGGAVVAGTTVYAYLTRPAAQAWGVDWVTGGGADVRFRAPVLADEPIDILPVEPDHDRWTVEARGAGTVRAVATFRRRAEPPGPPAGERLEPLVAEMSDRWTGYAARAGEDLALYGDGRLVHPVVWPSLANRVVARQLVDGPWIHTRSVIRHLGPVHPGDAVLVEAWLVDRHDSRAGERAVADVRMSVEGRAVAAVEHEAIVRPRSPDPA
jgi:acyl dehydratase